MVRKNKTNWSACASDMQIVLMAMIFTNAVNTMNDGFSWLALGVIISCLAFVVLTIYMKNTRFAK